MPNIYLLKDEVGLLKVFPTSQEAKKEQRWWTDEGIETTIKQVGYSNDRSSLCNLINEILNEVQLQQDGVELGEYALGKRIRNKK